MADQDDDEPELEQKAKPRTDAYTGMLIISLLVLLAGIFLIYLDFSQYPDVKPKKASVPAVEAGGAAPQEVKEAKDDKGAKAK